MSVRVGTSGWSYPSGPGTWNGIFYPAGRPRGFDELAYYAEHFDTVEVNSTFYRMPDAATSARWISRTPQTFAFAIKLYQKFTHPDMYLTRRGVADWTVTTGDLDEFRAGIDPIAARGRLAALLVQFPSSFHAADESFDYIEWLARALSAYPLAVELRHRSWSDQAPDTRRRLSAHDAAWVRIDEPKFPSSIAQSLLIAADEPSLVYIRLHGRNRAAWWAATDVDERYDYLYRPEELQPFADAAAGAAAAGRRVVMYLNNHFSAKAVANAVVLKHQLGEPIAGDYPREMVDRYPALSGIVATSGLPL